MFQRNMLLVIFLYWSISSSEMLIPMYQTARGHIPDESNLHVLCLVGSLADWHMFQILHAATNIVPSNVLITLFQVFSRVLVVCGVLLATPTGPTSPGLPLALVAWSITEVIRYLYYALNLLGTVPYLLVWCRWVTQTVMMLVSLTASCLLSQWNPKLLFHIEWNPVFSEHLLWSQLRPNVVSVLVSHIDWILI